MINDINFPEGVKWSLNYMSGPDFFSDDFEIGDGINLFYGNEERRVVKHINISKAHKVYNMFNGCRSLITIPQLETSNVFDMGYMFGYCDKLITIPQLNTSNVTNMDYVFYNCSELITIPQLNTSKVTSMSNMFYGCSKLTTIDITHMNITSNSNSNWFALNCNSLTKLIIRNMTAIPPLNSNAFNGCYHCTGTTNVTYNPQGLKDGRIYVPDDKVDALKTATNWSVYADIIVPLSTLVE